MSKEAMKITWKILNVLRYIACLPIILMLMMITVPLTLFFKWDGVIILAIANHVGCSFSEAKRLLKEDPRYQIRKGNKGFNAAAMHQAASDQFTNPTYSYMNTNINSSYYRGKSFGG